MKKKLMVGALAAFAITGGMLIAADHIDAPAVTGANSTSLGSDITDLYAFQSPTNSNNMVLVCNTQGLLSPTATVDASFPSNVMYEFNIDNNGDYVEDLVIQCLVQKNKLRVYGPVSPASTGTTSTVVTTGPVTQANVTNYGQPVKVGTNANGIMVFAGPRDDPFFFDLARFKEIIGGGKSGFRNPGVDAFAGTNVMSIVVEVPKSLLGSASTINVWAESKTK